VRPLCTRLKDASITASTNLLSSIQNTIFIISLLLLCFWLLFKSAPCLVTKTLPVHQNSFSSLHEKLTLRVSFLCLLDNFFPCMSKYSSSSIQLYREDWEDFPCTHNKQVIQFFTATGFTTWICSGHRNLCVVEIVSGMSQCRDKHIVSILALLPTHYS